MHLLKSQMRLKDMLMENFQKMMKFGWKRKNLRDRGGGRYVQSGQDQVSDRDEWADIHYGPATSRTTPRRPRYCKIYTKYAYASLRAMPKVLADRRDQRLAGERGKAVVRHAKSEQERRGDRQAGGKRGSKGNASSSHTDHIC